MMLVDDRHSFVETERQVMKGLKHATNRCQDGKITGVIPRGGQFPERRGASQKKKTPGGRKPQKKLRR